MIAKYLLNKQILNDNEFLLLLLEAAAASAKFGVLKEVERDNVYTTRANLHIMIILPFGSGKTTMLDIDNAVYANDVTFAGLIGTITENGEVLESAIMKAGGKVLVLDEFQKISEDVKNALNSILEYPHKYRRTLGYKINRTVYKKTKFYSIRAKINTNHFEVFSKFSCVAAGMFIRRKSTVEQAFFSRFMPVRFLPSLDFYEKLSLGEKFIKVNVISKKIDVFNFADYLVFAKQFWNIFRQSKFYDYFEKNEHERGYIVRCLQDIARFACFIASLDDRTDISKDDWQKALELQDFLLCNYIYNNLTDVEIFVLANAAKHKQKELAHYLNVSNAAVTRAIQRLKNLNILQSGMDV